MNAQTAAPTVYRRRKDEQVWHWCRNCSDWPSLLHAYESASTPPPGTACPECAAQARVGACTST